MSLSCLRKFKDFKEYNERHRKENLRNSSNKRHTQYSVKGNNMNELVKSQVKIMTDKGKYCSYKAMYGVVVQAMEKSENVNERHYFSALSKLDIIEKINGNWYPPESIRDEMVERELKSYGIYRRKKDARSKQLTYNYGFNCKDESEFIVEVLQPVIAELDKLEAILDAVSDEILKQKEVLKNAGLSVASINPAQAIKREVHKWERA